FLREFRMREGVGSRALIERLKSLRHIAPDQVVSAIPSVSSLNAMEHDTISHPKFIRLLLISIAIKTDLRHLLRAVGVNIADEGKVTVTERIVGKRAGVPGPELLNGVLNHQLAVAAATRWRGLPWLAPQLLGHWSLNSIFYIGRRSPFMHPMLAEQSF